MSEFIFSFFNASFELKVPTDFPLSKRVPNLLFLDFSSKMATVLIGSKLTKLLDFSSTSNAYYNVLLVCVYKFNVLVLNAFVP